MLPKWGIFREWNGIRFMMLFAPQSSVVSINVSAAQNHNTTGNSLECRKKIHDLFFCIWNHIQHHFGCELVEGRSEFRQAISTSEDVFC